MGTNNPILIISLILSGITVFRYFIYLVISPLYAFQEYKLTKGFRKISKRQIEKNTRVSVIVPAWNEEVGIVTSIQSLLRNNYKNLEIIVVNDGSKDGTDFVVKTFYEKKIKNRDFKGKRFIYINKQKNKGKGSAINSGIKRSTGDVIITMDADTKFEKDAIYTVAKYFQNPGIDAAVGNVKLVNSKSLLGLIQQVEYTFGFYFKRTHSVLNSEYIIGGAFGIFRRVIFKRCGYFDEKNKTEDIEFSTRIKNEGLRTIFIEDAIAYTEGPSTIKGLLNQRLRWKKGRMDTFLRYKELFLSTNKKHNKFLSWIMFPIALIGDIELIFFPLITPYIFLYTFRSQNFEYWIAWVVFLSVSIMLSFLFGSKKNGWKGFLIIPFFYLAAYFLVITEICAIWGSIRLYIKKADITWQTWNRKGVENV